MNMKKSLLCLYPRQWRTRYEEEFLALLECRPVSLSDSVDIILGALDAHFRPDLGSTEMSVQERGLYLFCIQRRSLVTLFCAYVSFVLAGLAFQKLTEYNKFMLAAHMYSQVGNSFTLVVIGSLIALLAVLIGALPIFSSIANFALRARRRELLLLLVTPLIALVLWLGANFLWDMLGTTIRFPPNLLTFISRVAFTGFFLLEVIISTLAVCLAVYRCPVPAARMHFAILPSALATVAMILMLLATIGWGFSLQIHLPQLFAENNGIMGSTTVGTWLGIVGTMGFSTVLAVVSFIRAFSAHSVLRSIS